MSLKVLDRLKELEANENIIYLIQEIEKNNEFLQNLKHLIVFVGNVGVGKSSLIGVVADLLLAPIKSVKEIKEHSILDTGSGRTTVCEVRIQASDGNDAKVGLLSEPFTEDEMIEEISLYAEIEYNRFNKISNKDDNTSPIALEIRRAICGMTGYVERPVRPIDAVISNYPSYDQFARHLIECARLPERNRVDWWWNAHTVENLMELKRCFAAINHGKEPLAMLPKRMTVVVPDPLPGCKTFDFTLIDTRGLDLTGTLSTREDLQNYFRDERALIILCVPFNDAPGESMHSLLGMMVEDAELRLAIPRILFLLLDHGNAEGVHGAEGDRESGQDLKCDECHRVLDDLNLPLEFDQRQFIAFDVLQDDRSRLVASINDRVVHLRQTVESQLNARLAEAQQFIESHNRQDQKVLLLRTRVDDALRETLINHLPAEDPPLRDPLEGLYKGIRVSYAAVVYATCRRQGVYRNLNLYAAVFSEAARAATAWLDDLIKAVHQTLDDFERDQVFKSVEDHIKLRKRQYTDARIKLIRSYADRVHEDVWKLLVNDQVWDLCKDEWGKGKGFINRVIDHLEDWSRRQQKLTAHEKTNAETIIPLMNEISRPIQSPRFTLHVRNLRALGRVNFRPEPLSVIVGANGTGKTTLFLVLRLLRIAYERDLPEAVSIMLNGSSNLISFGSTTDEVVELGLDIGDVCWRVQLTPRDGTVDYLTSERLWDLKGEIFLRDSLGTFFYRGERIAPSVKLGLRVLMDKGEFDPALRTIASFLQRIVVIYDPDLYSLRSGSKASDNRILDVRGTNALAVLRYWYQDRKNRHRYEFVIDGLNSAFPNTFEALDFEEAGNTLVARIYRPGSERPTPLANEANGVLQLLVLLCAVASAEDESIVAIDEPENCLHPYAVRAFLRCASRWAKQHHLTILLATHSTVLLDEFNAMPERVYVMKVGDTADSMPTSLDKLCNPDWLKEFMLGDLYRNGEIGSNEDDA
ncbi:MAG: AAA family ATPase [Magnetococcales bacterium]|nr:AAA family ATPase [Magnetococcales bacterium]MBF0438628.1 AAA family ATPase [Magnetococcales bacterium]